MCGGLIFGGEDGAAWEREGAVVASGFLLEIGGLDADCGCCAVISDPDDPKFDLEAYLTMKMGNEAK